MKAQLIIVFLFISHLSYSFVENTTKGYPNCMACHISPNGGGILTDYGRGLSSELMSTWKGYEGMENPYYGAVKNSENIKYGGQLRVIQFQAENDQVKVEKQFVMQNNLEFAVKYMQSFLVGTVGTKEGPDETQEKGEFLSERHYVLWESSENTRVRVGKFRQHFGINHPNHTRFVKTSLGFGSNSETYNFEFSQYFDWGEFNTSVSLGDFFEEKDEDDSKRNFAFNYTHYMGGSSRVGASLLTGKSDQYRRAIYGLNALIPLGQNWIGRSEIDYEQKSLLNSNDEYESQVDAIYGDHQFGYKVFKGGLGYFIFEHSQSNLKESSTMITSPGLGFQLLPLPHIEFQVEYQRRSFVSKPGNPEHRSFLTMHLYH